MKKLLTLIYILFLALVFPSQTCADENDEPINVVVTKQRNPKDPNPIGERAPSRPIYCVIDATSGISASGINKEEIISFDVCDENSIVIASFPEEEDFISYIFSISGCYEIRLNIGAYYYGGFIAL